MIEVLAVALGAAIGAPLRYLTDWWLSARFDSAFPWGTLLVNVIGSAVLGGLVGLSVDGGWFAFAGVGLCGALTTYSTFSYQTLRLWEAGAARLALTNAVVSVSASLAAAVLGFVVGKSL